MRHRRGIRGSGSTEPVISGPAQAVAAIRLSAPPAEGPAIVVLLCDRQHRLLLAITVEGGEAKGVGSVVDLVLGVADSAGVAGIVIGIVRERLGQYLAKPDAAGLHGVVGRCDAAGIDVLDVVLVGPWGWRSVYDLAEAPEGDQDGTR